MTKDLFGTEKNARAGRWLTCLLGLLLICFGSTQSAWAAGKGDTAATSISESAEPVTLTLYNREITELRGSPLGTPAAVRVVMAQHRFEALSSKALAEPIVVVPVQFGDVVGSTFIVDGNVLFSLMASDLDPEIKVTLAQATEKARQRLADALQARGEVQKPDVWLRGASVLIAVLTVWALGLWAVLRIYGRLEELSAAEVTRAASRTGLVAYLRVFGLRVLGLVVWLLFAGLLYAGTVTLLEAIPWMSPWGDQLAGFVTHLGIWLITGSIGAIPGLLTVVLILLVARAVHEVMSLFFDHAQSGRIRVPFMHVDTVTATRRILTVVLWVLALAIAYPYLPGSSSDAFKGVTVLLGVMLSLGSTGVVTQLMSGLVVIYSRAMRQGDYVVINDIEGVVSEVGAMGVKVVNLRNEEITVPNGVITNSSIHNYSKLARQQGTLLSTKIGIGYDTPWRQVHAMLTAAAGKCPKVRPQPEPYVYQRALDDFCVQYELFVHIDRPIERVAILSALHAAILDEFNTYGVQITSPHFMEQPPQPQVVPKNKWHAAPAKPPTTEA